jgi:hypothetical protein
LDELYNYGGSIEYQNGELDLQAEGEPAACDTAGDAAGTCGADPLLAQFQANDPATGKPYADDFGWISHTYDTPYLDVGCATQDYIEAELNENTTDLTSAPGATPGTGGLGVAEQEIAPGALDVANPYGTDDPQVFVPGNHSGFADLDPGTPATVDPPDLDEATADTGGTLGAGTYEYAVTDQFNGADSTSTDQSQAYVTDGLQGDLAPVVVGAGGSVSLVWQSICHAANYIIYRAPVTGSTVGPWTEIGTYATPSSATLPDASSGDSSPASTATVCQGPTYAPTSCAGEQELTFTDTGSDTSTPPAGVTYVNTPMPSGWTPPIVENANELPWEQNPYFTPALQAVGITTVGADASKAYPNPPNDTFGIGATYTGSTYAAGQPFVDGSAQVAPRHPINVFYNVANNAQELDEYNTLYDADAPDSQCHTTATTTCSTTPFTFAQVISSVVSGMLTNMLTNNPEISYVHQTNTMGVPPYSSILPPANYVPSATAQPGTDGDGTLYEVLNPLIAQYESTFTSDTPYVQLTMGGVGNVLADQTAWSSALSGASVTASEQNGVVTVSNTGTGSANVPITVPQGTTVNNAAFGSPYDGQLSAWTPIAADSSATLDEKVAPTITSAASANSIVGAPFSFTVTTTGFPVPALTETGSLPSGLTFTDNGDGTATISGTPAATTGGSFPITINATSSSGSTAQSFTLTNSEAPTITSPTTASFIVGTPSTYTVTTTGYPAATITESGTLPPGTSFTDNGNGTATITGTPTGNGGTYPVTISATNSSGSTATLDLTISVNVEAPPTITSAATAYFTLNSAGAVAVTTTGTPTPAITVVGTLPAGLTFVDSGNGTALLSGTPTATGTTALDITAANGDSPDATQTLTVIVGQAPTVSSAASATAVVGTASSFTVTTTGYPAPAIGETGTLPSGVTLTDNGNGTATLAGTPAASTGGTYPITIDAVNGTGSTTQNFTLTVQQPPVFTSATSATFSENTAGSFAITATGDTPITYTETGALPSGVTLASDGTLSGTPAFGTAGSYPVTLTATDTNNNPTTQSFTLTVSTSPPVFTSATSTTFSENTAGSFAVTANGDTPLSYTETGALPSGVTLATDGVLSGSLAFGSAGSYPITITATDNNSNTTTQSFTLTVSASPPVLTSATSATFSENTAGSFAATANGDSPIAYTETGALPSGVTLASDGTLSGSPDFGTAGSYPITITATDNNSNTTVQSFTLTVGASAPVFTSTTSTSFREDNDDSFAVTANGDTPLSYTETGALPSGVTLATNGALSGTPAFSSGGTYPITITATDGNDATTDQSFTLTVSATAPVMTSANSTTFSENTGGSFAVTANGDTPITFTVTNGNLPSGMSLTINGTLSGTPAFGTAGTYPITLTASDVHDQTTAQSFSLTVSASPPVFTSSTSTTFAENTAGSFAVTANGDTPLSYTETGSLPSGVALASDGTLSGTPAFGTAGSYPITITATDSNSNHTAQSFTLSVGATAPVFTSAASTTFSENVMGSFAFTANGDTPLSYSETGALPKGVALASSGILSGTPASGTVGSYPITITATDGNGDDLPLATSRQFMLVVNEMPLFTSAASTTFTKGVPGTFSVKYAGAPTPTLTESGSLPPGVRFVNGTIRGTPTALGTFHLTFAATNGVGPEKVQHFTLTVLGFHIVSTTLPTGTKGKAYSAKLSAIGGSAPCAWASNNGQALSNFGLSLAMNGVVHGTPLKTGTLRFKAQASFRVRNKTQRVTSVITLVIRP